MELQALAQLTSAPDMAGDPALATDFRTHYEETEKQAEKVRERLEALGGSPSTTKDAVMKLGGKGFLLFAKLLPETPGRLTAHAYAYEAMEWAGYELLLRMSEMANDHVTADMARSIQSEERAMSERLEKGFDAAESASHRETPPNRLSNHLRKHLGEAHAIEAQSGELLQRVLELADDGDMSRLYQAHLEETRDQMAWLEQRLEAMDGDRSTIKDSAMKLGGLNWSAFFRALDDSPAKFAAFIYAVEHLEIAGYELLERVARRAGDPETEQLCKRILEQEREMTKKMAEQFPRYFKASLEAAPDEARS